MSKERVEILTDEPLMKEARRRAKLKMGFVWHLTAYILVNSFLVILNFITMGGTWEFWAIWPMLGWGLGLAFHAAAVLFEFSHLNTRIVSSEYERLKRAVDGDVSYDYYVKDTESREN